MSKYICDISFGTVPINLQTADIQVYTESETSKLYKIKLRGRPSLNYGIELDLLCLNINFSGKLRLNSSITNSYYLEDRNPKYILKYNKGNKIRVNNNFLFDLIDLIHPEPEPEPEQETEPEPEP